VTFSKLKSFCSQLQAECPTISVSPIMSPARRLKIRCMERHSERDALRLVFARNDYDCRCDVPGSFPYREWRAMLADRFRIRFKL
jgi:hypothetical protein